MDKGTQQTSKRYCSIIFFLLLSVVCSGQDVWLDSTGNVGMTKEKFGYYYQCEQNLEAIEDSLPKIAKNIERERAAADSIKANLQAQIDNGNARNSILQRSREQWANAATTLEINNGVLRDKLKKERKKKWVFGGIGALLTILAGILI